jgi:cytochrome d ubiquinol oxidase subunit I
MDETQLPLHRLHFAITIAYHYLFPQLTMGLAPLVVVLKTFHLRTGDEVWGRAARFWGKLLGLSFAMGVVTGIPLEFQFGTNWARFAEAAGGVIGQTLAMEGVFAFFLESALLGLFLFGEKRISARAHWWTAFGLFVGSWLSGYFIVQTNAWMQHPVGHEIAADGTIVLTSLGELLTNPWGVRQYVHTMVGALITGCFAMASIASYWLLHGRFVNEARRCLRLSVTVGILACVLAAKPTGSAQAHMMAVHQPAAFAAMEGLFHTRTGAPIALIGQPDMERLVLDNPIHVPAMLSFLTYQDFGAEVRGLTEVPRDTWPDLVPLLYYAYHVMAGLGTIFMAVMGIAAFLLWRGRLYASRRVLWVLMLMLPLPFIANTAGWMTAELGRQPWVIHGIMRTRDAFSSNVSSGNTLFTLIGFLGLYALLGVLFLFLAGREIYHGPGAEHVEPESSH